MEDNGLCEGGTLEVDIASTVATLEMKIQMDLLEYHSCFPVGYDNEVARYVFNKHFRESMEEMFYSNNTKIFIIACISVPMAIGMEWLVDNRKRVKKFIYKYCVLTKWYVKTKIFLFKRLLFNQYNCILKCFVK